VNRRTRAALAVAVALGVAYLAYAVAVRPAAGINYRVYRVAAEAALAGEPIYGVSPAGLSDRYVYRYPPGTVLAFLPLALLPPGVGYAALTAVNVAGGVALAGLAARWARRRGVAVEGADRALLAAVAVGSSLTAPSLIYGNVNHVLAALVAWALVALDPLADGGRGPTARRATLAGAALGVAATVKLFPALLGGYLLLRRSWRAVAGAVAAGVGVVAVGVAAFGVESHRRYLTAAVAPRLEQGVGDVVAPGATYVTLQRPLSQPLDGPATTAVALAVGAAVVVAVAARERRRGGERRTADGGPIDGTATALADALAAVVVGLSYPLYLAYAYVPALVAPAVWGGRRGRVAAAGVVALHLAVQLDDVVAVVGSVPGWVGAALATATPPLVGVGACWLACLDPWSEGSDPEG